ncbi:hypothetical protein AQJ46_50695 [Streptomyces canus]|uniref:Tat pathway signal sequence domain protein n=1 Tax=Streptomyces canus TaxID=58343 RepID=A0A101RK18_9ACTN|nr:hypothetical protein AQJ46_50695 [Streptomyces canus]
MTRRIRRNAVISLVASSFVLGATVVLMPAATATPALGTYTVTTEGNGTRATISGYDWEPNQALPRAVLRPRTGDGPLEVTTEGQSIVMRIPLEGGGRLVVELTPDEAGALGDALTKVVNGCESTQPLSVRAVLRPRTGDGPLEVTTEGQSIVMRIPLEGGGRLVVELTPDEAGALGDALTKVVG